MSVFSAVLLGLLALWFLLSVLVQFRPVAGVGRLVVWVKSRDVLALIPAWTFFAPNPGTRDYELLYRDLLVDGLYTPWKEVERPVGSFTRALWNPAKRRQKAVVDLCSILIRMASRTKTELGAKQLVISVPYLNLLTYVSKLETSPLSAYRQFLIATTFGYHSDKKPEICYVSNLHALDEAQAPLPPQVSPWLPPPEPAPEGKEPAEPGLRGAHV
jgi:hypothetical protein